MTCRNCGECPCCEEIADRTSRPDAPALCPKCLISEAEYIRRHYTREEQDAAFPWMTDAEKTPRDR